MTAPTTASILIVNYNYGRYLSSAIDSALGQTWPNVQVVVVDDGSTDESPLVMQTYGNQIQTIYKENGGQASGTNAAFPILTGEAVIFLDADDLLEPDAIEKTLGFFEDPEVIRVYWPFTIIDRTGTPTGEIRYRRLRSGNFRRRALKIGPASHFTSAHSGNFWRKSFLDEVFPVHETDFRNIVDAYLFTFAPFFGSFHATEEPLTRYRVHGASASSEFTAVRRRAMWDVRARHLHTWLTARGETVSVDKWRANNSYYVKLDGIARGQAKIGNYLPKDAPLALLANELYDRADIRPHRPVYRLPGDLAHPDCGETDFRPALAILQGSELIHLAVQGPAMWKNTNLGALVGLLRNEHDVLYEDEWIVLARLAASVRSPGELSTER